MSRRTRALQLLGGSLLGLALAEGLFRYADDGAFAHVNFYVPDAALGVRLEPGATERIAFGGNPVTSVRVNAEGYRGADWGPPEAREIVVLGDSQVFGLGVEEDRTASAVLAKALGRPVRNAGVPTYGPGEYLAVMDELLATRKPATVVLVLNFSNDIFEKDTPNTQRHAVWDGWAVRLETAPADVFEFPGRTWLMSQSHLVMAARRAWWTPPEAWDQGVPSEGTWKGVLTAAAPPQADVAAKALAEQIAWCDEHVQKNPDQMETCARARASAEEPGGPEEALARQVDRAADERVELEYGLIELYRQLFRDSSRQNLDLIVEAAVSHAHPGDIVGERYAEMSREIVVTAEQLREGARIRAELDTLLSKWAAEHKDTRTAKEIEEALKSRGTLDAELSALATRVAEEVGGRSPLLDVVEAAKARCDAAGAELVVVALPLDVQVSDGEWKKYGVTEPIDMSATRVLLTDLVTNTTRLGIRALDATVPLAAAEPGAFLNADLHMSAKGQAALGAALATVVQAPPPPAMPRAGLPSGRSRVPTLTELELAREVVVRGSTKNHCSTRTLREWLLVDCTSARGAGRPEYVVPVSGAELLPGRVEGRALLVAPLLPGRDLAADFVWEDRAERLSVTWRGDTARMGFSPTPRPPPPEEPACASELRSWQLRFGDLTRGCEASFAIDCDKQWACAAGTRAPTPTCPDGQANAGSAGFCYALCDATHPCSEGTCTEWQGAGVCM